jgi:type IV secretory pathway VirJ component
MARKLAALDALVVGINIIHYLKQLESSTEKCSYPAADFEALSQFVQKQLNYPSYVTPILVGYSSGATLV